MFALTGVVLCNCECQCQTNKWKKNEQLGEESTSYFDEHANETVARLASNSRMIEKLRVENNQLRQKLRQQLSVEMCRVDVADRWDNNLLYSFIYLNILWTLMYL